MRIFFVLPKVSRFPVGGYKVVFEYANRFYQMGYKVEIIYMNNEFLSKYPIPTFVRKLVAKIYTIKEPSWFFLEKEIRRNSFYLGDKFEINHDDCLIATAVQTAEWVNACDCNKIYFIQGYENWGVTEEYLLKTYEFPMKKVVVGDWLKKIVDNFSLEKSIVIKNPIDTNVYKTIIPLKKRKRHSIAVLYNELPEKGFEYSYKALILLKNQYADLTVHMFGRKEYPGKLPNWIEYTENASQKETVNIYNESYVYLCSSIKEGYGLTGLEAMSCGCVLVSTRFEGALEYADDKSAFLSNIKDIDGIVENVKKAFNNLDLCEQLTQNAKNNIIDLSWDKAISKFRAVIDGENIDEF